MLLAMAAQVDFFSSAHPYLFATFHWFLLREWVNQAQIEIPPTPGRLRVRDVRLFCGISLRASLSDHSPHLISLIIVTIQSEALPPIFGAQPVKFKSCSSWSVASEILANFLWKLLFLSFKLIKKKNGGFGAHRPTCISSILIFRTPLLFQNVYRQTCDLNWFGCTFMHYTGMSFWYYCLGSGT